MDKYLKTNVRNWDERVALHAASRFYNVSGFLRGKTSLSPLELKEVGPVMGKKLLHLQCHFGLDTLSLARRGAAVTGADFSPKAIARARALAAKAGLPAKFVLADVFALPRALEGKFDVVYATYGVFCWIGDLARWFRTAAHFLKPDGFLYVADDHPFAGVFDDAGRRLAVDYFLKKPVLMPPASAYTDGPRKKLPPAYEWRYTVNDLLEGVKGAGLKLDYLHEHPFSAWKRFPGMRKGADGLWRRRGPGLPLLFSLKAYK